MREENNGSDSPIGAPSPDSRPREEGEIRPEKPDERGSPGDPEDEHTPAARGGKPESRIERNHPLDLRVLALEKNEILTAKKLEDIKRIIAHQNERIRLLEEELEITRKALNPDQG